MAEKQNIPEIRFEGFTDPWEQRKLNEYLETSREKNESCHFGKDDVLSVSGDYGIVNQIEFQGRSYAGTSVANYGVVHKGDVVYTKSPLRINPYGIIKTNRGNDGIVSTLYAVYHPTEKTHPDFVQVYFEQNARMNNYMAPLVSKGAKNDMKVSAENALKGAVTFPGIKEQEVIASYFSQLDDLITLHQRKCQYRSLYGYLSWEQRKLGEVASEFQSGEFISATEITENGDYPVYGGNGLRGYANRYNHEGFYALIGRQGALCGNVNCADGKAYFTEHAVAVQANQCNDTGFLVYLLSRMNLGQYSGQSAQPGLAVSTLKEVETLLPSKHEQYRIGSLLKYLDSLITLHQ